MQLRKNPQGFTIVELLIVIVVIAILAAITIVSFNGIQSRAKTTQIQAAVNAYEKAIKMYKVENGSFPNTSDTCLGNASHYPATADFPAGACVADQTTHAAVYSVSSTFNSAIAPYLPTLPPVPSDKPVVYSGRVYRGAYVYTDQNMYEIQFGLPSSISCPGNYRQYNLSGILWCERDSSES